MEETQFWVVLQDFYPDDDDSSMGYEGAFRTLDAALHMMGCALDRRLIGDGLTLVEHSDTRVVLDGVNGSRFYIDRQGFNDHDSEDFCSDAVPKDAARTLLGRHD